MELAALKKLDDRGLMHAFIDAFAESGQEVLAVGRLHYKSPASARIAYKRYIDQTHRERMIAVSIRKGKIFLIRIDI